MKNLKLFLLSTVVLTTLNANDISQEEIGKVLFFDPNLSANRTQSCATCHNPQVGFIDDRDNGVSKMASLGDDLKSLGDRQAPTASYAKFSPEFHFDSKKGFYVGGQFWDGRASTLEEQAGGPPLNPIEMGMKDEKEVIARIKENNFYVDNFKRIFGDNIFKDDKKAYEAMTKLIASFERTDEFSPFDSKYDRYLKGEYDLTPLEDLGMSIFFSNNNNSCATCHVLKGEDREGETFSNYEFHNIGVPINHKLRAKNGAKEKDLGLLANPNINDEKQIGKYKTPSLRNVAVTGPYMHNGVFQDLRTVVLFYDKYNNKNNTINPETNLPWDEAEHKDTIALKELKANAQNDRKVDALVAFMKLLTDKKYEHLIEE
ncbi:cytochrome-c peroxidase [Arcobacter porcinus]|uniref:Methylamine utilization protein MauG n=1 Tax=Arcobacter porcinus TaxID=1935204 RepID=A0ABX2YA53_9BACT|nr:cytochrome c peroxidase [Arcobacter porcinus]OCL81589.1 Methylamine utilization protein MauG precursor [Arcobacter porcinus]OCL90249.1 Methylamine utilization protein MauG precursor [Arcobacter porcinus]